MERNAKVFIAGGTGLVGSALIRKFSSEGFQNIVSSYNSSLPKDEYDRGIRFVRIDLRRQVEVETFFEQERPDYVLLAAAKVGGIRANNTYRADFIYDNIMISTNIIHASFTYNTKKLLNLASSCVYPKFAPQPLKEEFLMTGPLEATNEPYAIAKISALKLCKYFNEQYGTNFISVMPTNLYGPNDNYDLENSHVLPALLAKIHKAKINNQKNVTIWGTGKPFREFLHSDDLADACFYLMQNFDAPDIGQVINIGTGRDISIKNLAELVMSIVGFKGHILFDASKPDGTPRKCLDVSRLTKLGWTPSIRLKEGIKKIYVNEIAKVGNKNDGFQ